MSDRDGDFKTPTTGKSRGALQSKVPGEVLPGSADNVRGRKIPISTTVRAVDKKKVFRKTDPKYILASDRVTN